MKDMDKAEISISAETAMTASRAIQTSRKEDLERISMDDRAEERLVPAYWKSLGQTRLEVYGRCKEQINPTSRDRLPKNEQGTMPEHILIFETIWMLEGLQSSCVYQWLNGSYSVAPNIRLVNVDYAVLLDMLQPFANHGTMLRTLYAYVADTQQKYDGACIDGRTSALLDFVLCVQSFCASFRDFLAKLRSDLNRCLAKGWPYGILHLLEELRSVFRDLNFIHGIFHAAVAQNGPVDECCRFSEHALLDVIRSKFEEVWLTDDRSYGKTVWPVLALVCRRHGDLQYLSHSNMGESGMYRDLVTHIAVCLKENSAVILAESERPSATPLENWPGTMNPLLRLHFSALH